jgi:flagellar hook-length control protein FliK
VTAPGVPGATTPGQASGSTADSTSGAPSGTAAKPAAPDSAIAAAAKQQATPSSATTAIDLTAATTVSVAAQPTPKAATPTKADGTTPAKAARTASTATPTGATPGQANAAANPTNPAQPAPIPTFADAMKADGSNGSATAPSHDDHGTSVGDPTAAVPTSPDASVQAAAAFAPQTTGASAAVSSATLTATAATAAPVPIGGLAVAIAASVQSGKTRFELRLDPADLGRIDVRIDVDRNGQVTSHLTVEKPETLSMLQQDAPQLQQALNDAGLKSGNGGLQFSLRDQSSSGQNFYNPSGGGNARQLIINDEDAVAAPSAGRSYGRMLSASGGVDIRI